MNRQRILLGFSLFTLIWSIYTATFNGRIIVVDEAQIFDATESLVHRGTTSLNYDFYHDAQSNKLGGWELTLQEICQPADGDPWQDAKYEPTIYFALTPFVATAFAISDVSNFSIIFYFNILVTVLTALSIYGFAIRLGYTEKAAYISAILFAFGTIAWFYARQLYRDPLSALFLLWVFGLAAIFKDSKRRKIWVWGILFGLSILGTVSTKMVLVSLIPVPLLLMVLTHFEFLKRNKRYIAYLAVGTIILFIGFMIAVTSGIIRHQDLSESFFTRRLNDLSLDGFLVEGMLGFHVSPGRSLWLYSPILLLGFYGAYLLWKNKKWPLVVSLLIGIVGFTYVNVFARTSGWHGAWSWGPRYMVPLIPVIVLLWVVPAVEHLLQTKLGVTILAIVGLSGVLIQLIGMAVLLSNYYTDVYLSGAYYDYNNFSNSEIRWLDAHWSLEWMPIYDNIRNIDWNHMPLAITQSGNIILPAITLALLAILSLGVAIKSWQPTRDITNRNLVGLPSILGVLLIVSTASSVYAFRDDDRYITPTTGEATRELARELNNAVGEDSIVFMDNLGQTEVYMNYYKNPATLVTIPYPAAEFGIRATLDDPIDERIGEASVCAIHWGADEYQWLWLAANYGPFTTENLRPIERYLATQYFPTTEIETAPNSRGIQFLTVDTPTGTEPSIALATELGDQLNLVGIDLPLGTEFKAGAGLPVSLVWEPIDAPTNAYNVGIYLLDSSGALHVQRDSQPQGTFGNMQFWEVGTRYRDNHALDLPQDLPAGTYTLALKLYRWEDGGTLAISNNENGGDLVILATIEITN